ncbi:MAG TPA: hypothetical protein V6D17_18435 [Candidatus Obscuribacterales bacterium]
MQAPRRCFKTSYPLSKVAYVALLFGCVLFWSLPSAHAKLVGPGRALSLADQQREYEKMCPNCKKESPEAAKEAGPGELTEESWANTNNKMANWKDEAGNQPKDEAQSGAAQAQSQESSAANAIGEVARDQGVNAIEFTSKFMRNFTVHGGKWNKLRDQVFVPMAVLLLLPGAVITQVKAIAAANNPALEPSSSLEGIQRAMVALFLIPASYLVVNYGIDFANSISFTIATEYSRKFGSNMYIDAMCAEIRAFTPRHYAENDGSLKVPPFNKSPFGKGLFSKIESDWGKLYDPCLGLNLAPKNRDDGAATADTIMKRLILNTINATFTISWGVLCAFQVAFLYYLYFAGPIMAALWTWPTKMLREAFPHWVESVVIMCFWSLFWHMTILLMACLKGLDDTGIMMMSALNLLALVSVKFAFDSAGMAKGAGHMVERQISKAVSQASQSAGGGGGGGGGKSGGKGGCKGGSCAA